MNSRRPTKKSIEMFPAALLSQRRAWEGAAQLLPANTCLLVTDTTNQKQTEIMRRLAKTFRDEGWLVLIWMSPNSSQNSEHNK